MMTLTKTLRLIREDDSGATAIEYGLIIALIALALVGTLTTFSGEIQTFFSNLSGQVNATLP